MMPPPPGMLPGAPPIPLGMPRPSIRPPPAFVPAGSPSPYFTPSANGMGTAPVTGSATPTPTPSGQQLQNQPPPPRLPNPTLEQKYTPFKKKTELKYAEPNFSPEEKRAHTSRYYFAKDSTNVTATTTTTAPSVDPAAGLATEETRGKKRARAEDFL
jgi:hypothetical protein